MSGNPMRYNCDLRGCFNQKKRPKIEVFHECFPRGINFGDVDGIVEIGGQLLFLEWKPAVGAVMTGQRRLHYVLVSIGATVLIVAGDAETMAVESFVVRNALIGKDRVVNPASLDALKAQVAKWAQWADSSAKRAA